MGTEPPAGRRRPTVTAAFHPRRRVLVAFVGWTLIGSVPALVSGWSLATAVDRGFLTGRVLVGAAWLVPMLLAAVVASAAARRISPLLGELVEPVRDELVVGVATHEVARSAAGAGRTDHRGIAAVIGQTDGVRDLSARLLGDGASVVAVVVAAVIGLASLDPLVAAIVAGPPLVTLAALALLAPTLVARGAAALEADEAVAAVAADTVVGARDIRSCGAEHEIAARTAAVLGERAEAGRSLARAVALRTIIGTVGAQLSLVALLAAAPTLLSSGRLSVGGVIGAVTYLTASLQPALSTVVSLTTETWLQLGVLLRRIETRLEPHDPDPAPTRRRPARRTPRSNDLVVSGLRFAYGTAAAPIVDGLDLIVPDGDHLAVVGASGVGKSTLADLLAGLTPPEAGRVTLGGRPVAAATDGTGQIALVPQEAYVFAGSLGENVRYLRPEATAGDLARAAAEVGAAPLVERLGGWDAEVDPRTLSAGERQLITLARTWLAPAPVVILDEATCHLDPAAEATAELAFARRPGTLIVIAHRISSARRAERILVMDGDRTCAGTHRELLAASAAYRALTTTWAPAPVAAGRHASTGSVADGHPAPVRRVGRIPDRR